MEPQLLVCVKRTVTKFLYEDFTPEDDILILVASGSFQSAPAGRVPERMEAGDGAWFRSGVRYFRKVLEPAQLYLFRFRPEGRVCPGHKLTFHDRERIFSTVRLLELLEQQADPGDFSYKRALFQDVMNQLAIESRQESPGRQDTLMEEAAQYLRDHLHRRLLLEPLSRRYGMSYVHFCRRFSGAMGMPPSRYLWQQRLQKACTMLTETKLPVYTVASECGFESEYYFSNRFKKHTGHSPSAYRKLHSAGEDA